MQKGNLEIEINAIKCEELENIHVSSGYNFLTNYLILLLKTSTRPYSCLTKVIINSV